MSLSIIVTTLTLANLIALYIRLYTHHAGDELLTFIIYFFNTEAEWNLPAFYSAGAILLAAGLLALTAMCIGENQSPDRRYWLGLGAMFTYLAFDELCRIHERLNDIMPGLMKSIGMELPAWFKWAWVLPVGVAVLVIGLLYLGFVFRLARRTRRLFILAGCIYVGGAMGMEIAAMLIKRVEEHSMYALLASAVEECMEMTGIVIFIHALLVHMRTHVGALTVQFTTETREVTADATPVASPRTFPGLPARDQTTLPPNAA